MLLNQNELAKLRQKLEALEVEYKHFSTYYEYSEVTEYLKPVTSDTALELWLLCERYIERNKMPVFFGKIINRFRRGVINKSFYSLEHHKMIALCQQRYYTEVIRELKRLTQSLERALGNFNFDKQMSEYGELSVKIFRNGLANKYLGTERHKFEIDELWKNSNNFINEYPVILATTYSLRASLSHNIMYDYVIIDEASQVDLATGALALSCAKSAVIVGDLMQLPNVVNSEAARKTDAIFSKYRLPEVYRYSNHSLLATVSELFPGIPRTLLREHYRCHPKIIDFCNQRFYNNQLIILTENKSKSQPLTVYKTVPGDHARERVNQRQIDVIMNEILPSQVSTESIEIVTPYRNQTNALQDAFEGTTIQADTVDKFQGRENDIIILSTVDNIISEFADNANRLNVAVSRAIEQLIVVVNSNEDTRDTNIADLISYIEYNNFDIIQS